MSKLLWILIGVATVFLGGLALVFMAVAQLGGSPKSLGAEGQIGLLRIEGEIMDALPVLSQIDALREQNVAGVLVRVDSPGGAVGASQEIYDALLQLRKDSIPVVITMGNTAASGGYYISLAGEKVFANAGTVTGSIGVIAQFPEAKELFDRLGVHMNTIKSGANKDVGNPFRKPEPAELATMQGMIMDAYAQFFEATRTARKLDSAKLAAVADGRILTGRQALAAGLIDTLGGYTDALRYLKTLAKVDADAEIIDAEPPKPLFERLMQQSMTGAGSALREATQEAISGQGQGLLYMSPALP
jgi:protease-4